jgi:hypothetical protein
MATTETRTGFRLPWSSEPRTTDETPEPAAAAEDAASESVAGTDAVERPSADPGAQAVDASAAPTAPMAGETEPQTRVADAPETTTSAAADGHAVAEPTLEAEKTSTTMLDSFAAPSARAASTTTAKRPTKFLADLTRAMQSAAEVQRAEILERFQAEAKSYVEQINEKSGTEATELRSLADDDVAKIRDWSKAEIARIREETDERIAHRKSRLDGEIEAHAARIEREIERVKATVEGFEADMSRFFEGLMNEDDPTSFAERAANLPEPPSLDDVVASVGGDRPEPDVATPAPVATITPVATTPPATTGAPVTTSAPVRFRTSEVVAEPSISPSEPLAAEPAAVFEKDPPRTHETPAAEIPAVEADQNDVPTPEVESPGAEVEVEAAWPAAVPTPDGEATDPRVAALGLTPDFAAAEAEARANVEVDQGDDGSADDVPALDDDTIAARLAGLPQVAAESAEETRSTQVVVTGLVSVASIAGFKRHLGRLPGVKSVGVSSGPEGEFLFSVTHGEEVALHEAIPTLPGFAARVTASGEGVLNIAAHDPETDA